MSDILSDEIIVEFANHEYVFRIPSINFELEVGARVADIRRRATPNALYQAIDFAASQQARYMAIFELYLKQATTLWPYGYTSDDMSKVDWNKTPAVDSQKFPVQKLRHVLSIGAAFEEGFARFCSDGDIDERSAIPQAVARIGHPRAS